MRTIEAIQQNILTCVSNYYITRKGREHDRLFILQRELNDARHEKDDRLAKVADAARQT